MRIELEKPEWPPDAPLLLTADDLRKRLKVTRSWIKEQLRERTKIRNPKRRPLPCVRLSKNVIRFDWRDVVKWIEEQKTSQ
jgi:hypothetical protein